MYNGIGLATTRGSGTNGHVTLNSFTLRPGWTRRDPALDGMSIRELHEAAAAGGPEGFARAPDPDLLAHQRKRQLELRLVPLRDEMEAQGYAEAEVEAAVAAKRAEMAAEEAQEEAAKAGAEAAASHQRRARKAEQMGRLRDAFGLGGGRGQAEGDAFDFDLQEKKKAAKQERREEEEEERAKARRAEEVRPAPRPSFFLCCFGRRDARDERARIRPRIILPEFPPSIFFGTRSDSRSASRRPLGLSHPALHSYFFRGPSLTWHPNGLRGTPRIRRMTSPVRRLLPPPCLCEPAARGE